MNKFIINCLSSFRINNVSKLLLTKNPHLFEDNEFINNVFEKSCLDSNMELAIFLYNNDTNPSNMSFNASFYQELFAKMCLVSDLGIIIWFHDRFSDIIGLEDKGYIINSIENPDIRIFKYITEFYNCSDEFYEYIFKISVSKLNIQLAKLIYSKKPDINLEVLADINLYNSIDIHTPKARVDWLKIICSQQSYDIKIGPNYMLEVTDELNISNEKPVFDIQNNLSNNMDFVNPDTNNECVLCFEFTNNIILNCSHQFCSHCIRKWMKKNHSCPICRNDENIKIFYIKNI
jgi:hypothetical protein